MNNMHSSSKKDISEFGLKTKDDRKEKNPANNTVELHFLASVSIKVVNNE